MENIFPIALFSNKNEVTQRLSLTECPICHLHADLSQHELREQYGAKGVHVK